MLKSPPMMTGHPMEPINEPVRGRRSRGTRAESGCRRGGRPPPQSHGASRHPCHSAARGGLDQNERGWLQQQRALRVVLCQQ
eukprot:316387-Pyramimonas_sp.AAC.1